MDAADLCLASPWDSRKCRHQLPCRKRWIRGVHESRESREAGKAVERLADTAMREGLSRPKQGHARPVKAPQGRPGRPGRRGSEASARKPGARTSCQTAPEAPLCYTPATRSGKPCPTAYSVTARQHRQGPKAGSRRASALLRRARPGRWLAGRPASCLRAGLAAFIPAPPACPAAGLGPAWGHGDSPV